MSNPSELAAALLKDAVRLDPEKMRSQFEAYLASWRDADVEARAALFAPDAIVEDPVGGRPLIGIEEIRSFWAMAAAQGHDFAPRLELFIPGGAEALIRFAMTMRKPREPDFILSIHEVAAFDSSYRIVSLRAFYSATSAEAAANP